MSRGRYDRTRSAHRGPFRCAQTSRRHCPEEFWGRPEQYPQVPWTTRRAGKRVGYGERLLTIGGHLRRGVEPPSARSPLRRLCSSRARSPFGVAPGFHDAGSTAAATRPSALTVEKAEAQETTELLHARVVLSAASDQSVRACRCAHARWQSVQNGMDSSCCGVQRLGEDRYAEKDSLGVSDADEAAGLS